MWIQLHFVSGKSTFFNPLHPSLITPSPSLRHTCFLLQRLHLHLSGAHLKEIIDMLEDIVKEAEEAQMDKKAVVRDRLASPVSLSEFPSVCSFTPQPLGSTLAPHRRAGFTSSDQDSTSTVNNMQQITTKTKIISLICLASVRNSDGNKSVNF